MMRRLKDLHCKPLNYWQSKMQKPSFQRYLRLLAIHNLNGELKADPFTPETEADRREKILLTSVREKYKVEKAISERSGM